jgi:hypothetical protein
MPKRHFPRPWRFEPIPGGYRVVDASALGAAGINRDGRLGFVGPAILNPPQALRAAWRERIAALAIAKPPRRGLRQGSAQWLWPELRVRVKHLKARGTLRRAIVKALLDD